MIRENSEYKLLRFEKAKSPKKYNAVLLNKKTGREKRVPFGSAVHEQYRDDSGLGLWSHKNHLDKERRRLYRLRHAGEGDSENFPNAGYWAWWILWP